MRLPIQYALSYPERLNADLPRLDLFQTAALTFERPDMERFPCLSLAYEAIRRGGNIPCVLNAANEVVNMAYRQGEISFYKMADVIADTMAAATFIANPTYEDLVETDRLARQAALKLNV